MGLDTELAGVVEGLTPSGGGGRAREEEGEWKRREAGQGGLGVLLCGECKEMHWY